MSQSVLEALKNIDAKSSATKWILPEKKSEPVPQKKEEEPKSSSPINEAADKSEPKKENNNLRTVPDSKPEQKEEQKPSTENNELTSKKEIEEKSNDIESLKGDSNPQTKSNSTPQQKEEQKPSVASSQPPNDTKVTQATKPVSNATLSRNRSEPAPDFKKKLEEIHSKPNRPGVIAQHEFNYQEPPEKHASYTQLKKKSTWAGPAPQTFGQKVDWLGETGEFHYYQYKQPERKNYNDYSNTQSNVNVTAPPSERNTGVDQTAVPTKSKFSALLSIYNNNGQ